MTGPHGSSGPGDRAHRLYRISLVALSAGLVLLAGVLIFGGGLGVVPAHDPPAGGGAVPSSSTSVSTRFSDGPMGTPTATASPTADPTETPVPPTATATPPPTATEAPTLAPTDVAPTASAVVTDTAAESGAGIGTETVVPTGTVTSTEAVTATALITTPVRPDDPGSPFYQRMWVGLYGTPLGRGLGILGTATATETVSMAVGQALAYQELITSATVMPFFHMVVTIADAHPGADGDYVHHVPTDTVHLWIDVAQQHGLLSVVDIQPGYSPLTSELAYVDEFVRRPGVHLAIDPEFMMLDGVSIPGQRLGSMTGALVNVAQAWLSDVATAVGERKVLVIHQFDPRMFSGKEEIESYPMVDLVWDADGFGGPGAKIGDYDEYAAEPGFEYGGFKLFYNYDTPLMTPAQVIGLLPLPAFVVYQ